MDWGEFSWGEAITVAGIMWAVALIVMEAHFRKKFASKTSVCDPQTNKPLFLTVEDAAGMSKRIDERMDAIYRATERNAGLFVALDDRTGDLEGKVGRIEERQTQQWERISDQMRGTADTIRDVTVELKKISEAQQALALELAKKH